MHVGTVYHRIRIAKTLSECLTCGDFAHLVSVHGIVHHHVIGVYRHGACRVAYAQSIKSVKRIGPQLYARTDFTDGWRLFKHLDVKTAFDQGQGRGKTAYATAGNEYGLLSIHDGIPFVFCFLLIHNCGLGINPPSFTGRLWVSYRPVSVFYWVTPNKPS